MSTTTDPAIADTRDPRDAARWTAEKEAAHLHRQVSEMRVDLEGAHARARELETQLRAATGEVGRAVVARLCAHIPEGVADVMTGARHIDEAMQAALDAAVTEADQLREQRDRAVERTATAERERDDARAELARIRADHTTGNDCESGFRTCSELARDVDRYRAERNHAWARVRTAEAEVARLTAHLHPRPEPVDLVALGAQARREAQTGV